MSFHRFVKAEENPRKRKRNQVDIRGFFTERVQGNFLETVRQEEEAKQAEDAINFLHLNSNEPSGHKDSNDDSDSDYNTLEGPITPHRADETSIMKVIYPQYKVTSIHVQTFGCVPCTNPNVYPGSVAFFAQKIKGLFKDFPGQISHFARTTFSAKKSLDSMSFFSSSTSGEFYPKGLCVCSFSFAVLLKLFS